MYKLSSVCADKASVKLKTSIPNVITVIHTAYPNCVYCIQLISLAHFRVLVGGGLSEQKMNAYTYISIPKYFCTTIATD